VLGRAWLTISFTICGLVDHFWTMKMNLAMNLNLTPFGGDTCLKASIWS
jgi:hypothetical protein